MVFEWGRQGDREGKNKGGRERIKTRMKSGGNRGKVDLGSIRVRNSCS